MIKENYAYGKPEGKIIKYTELLIRAKEIIRQAQYDALKAVNKSDRVPE